MPDKTKFVFPTDQDPFPQARYCGYLLAVFGIATAFSHLIVGLFFIGLSAIIILVFRPKRLVLDIKKQTVSSASVFSRESLPFKEVDRLLLKSAMISQRISSRGSSHVIKYQLYRAYLVSESDVILLGESKKKRLLEDKLKAIADTYAVTIHDET